MRVLYLTMNPNRASTTVPTEGWFRLLRDRGLEPVLVSHTSGAFQAWTREQGIPAYEVPLPFPDRRRPFPFLRSLARVLRIARKHRIELVHCNEHEIYPVGQYAARIRQVPVVTGVHCTLRDGFSKWAFGGPRCPSRVFFVSRSSLEACRPDVEGNVPEDRWRVLYNGLDMDRFRPDLDLRQSFRKQHGLNGMFCVGVACALRPGKQLEHLFEAVARLGDPSVRLVLAGAAVTGDEEYSCVLLRQGRDLLGERLVYLGHQHELRPLYNALDICVNTSKEESFGISVLEAMSCGCPVLGYPSVSVSEVVGDAGEIVAQDSVTELSAALRRWRADAYLPAARAKARERAETAFDIRGSANQLWTEYQQILR
jgi:glycosyltransferase involved in cell wall biosynthesis